MTTQQSEINEAARLWAVRVGDAAFDDWDALTGWLEENSAHLAAYEAAVADEKWADETFERPDEPKAKSG